MSKIRCMCGEQLSDSSDFLSYKGYLVPDQDLDDFVSASDESGAGSALHANSRDMFQCDACGRLIVQLRRELHFFSPDDASKSHKALRSVHHEAWMRPLRARWSGGAGEVWWGFGVEDEGFESGIATWEETSARYFEVLERLERNGQLRNAILTRDGHTEHRWPVEE